MHQGGSGLLLKKEKLPKVRQPLISESSSAQCPFCSLMFGGQAELNEHAWYRGNSNRKYHQPGAKEPNALGIHDMLGNVAEWTFDQYHEDYASTLEHNPADNPYFKPTELYPRTVKGGSWMDPSSMANCSSRRGSSPNWKMHDPQLPKSLWWHTNALFLGFRIVEPKNQPATIDEMSNYWIEEIQDYY